MNLRCICLCVLALALVVASCENKPHCPEGQSLCWTQCVNLMKDDDNCGQCDNQCDPHSDCVEGRCECNPGFTDCSGFCINLDFDAGNCGDCGNACTNGEFCYNGVCGNGDCESFGLLVCGDSCIDPLSDNAHCGECYNACRDDQTCIDGICECNGSLKDCNDVCVDAHSDPENCGECGNQCASNQFCDQGHCANVESNELGDPCPFDTVNATANYCVAGLECLGFPADGNAGTCPGGESYECANIPFELNYDCVDGNCGASFCSQECDHCGECPEGFGPQDVGSPPKCMCIPGMWVGPGINACPLAESTAKQNSAGAA